MGAAPIIEVKDFKKTFRMGLRRKRFEAARGISFTVHEGEIFGFLGPNGAGKTTSIKAMLGLIRPDSGELRLLGRPVRELAWRAHVGYLPEHPTFYEYLTGLELVTWFGRLAGLSRQVAHKEAERHLERVGLTRAMNQRLRSYSKGMLQRAGLAQTLIGNPKLLILDEPMTGLDPIGRKDIRELILQLRAEGRTVFYSTHILPDVEMTCDRVAIVDRGQVRQEGQLEDILRQTTRGVSVVVSGLEAMLAERVLADHPGSTRAGETLQVEFAESQAARAFVEHVVAKGATIEKFEPHRDSLEAIFLKSMGRSFDALRNENQ